MNSFTFNGINSKSLGVICSGSGTFNAPERDVTEVEIPGRSGNLVIDNKRFRNVAVTYPAFITTDFAANTAAVRSWLLAPASYCRLEDDYHPDEYRMARYAGSVDFSPRFLNRSGDFNIVFDCKPQRYLKTGEQAVTIEASGDAITNPTNFEALPLLHVTGTGDGEVVVNGTTIQIMGMVEYLDIDCDAMVAYKGLNPANGNINAMRFPVLSPGDNIISWSGDVSGVEITPRWWRV